MGRKLPLRWASDAGSKLTIVGFSDFSPPAHFHVMISLCPQLRAECWESSDCRASLFVIDIFDHSFIREGVGSLRFNVRIVVQPSVSSDININDRPRSGHRDSLSLRLRQPLFSNKVLSPTCHYGELRPGSFRAPSSVSGHSITRCHIAATRSIPDLARRAL